MSLIFTEIDMIVNLSIGDQNISTLRRYRLVTSTDINNRQSSVSECYAFITPNVISIWASMTHQQIHSFYYGGIGVSKQNSRGETNAATNATPRRVMGVAKGDGRREARRAFPLR